MSLKAPFAQDPRDPVEVFNDVCHKLTKFTTNQIRIKFPRICVVGAQSTGKSTVLSRLVGENILPVKSTMCTRCPIVLELVPLKQGDPHRTSVRINSGKVIGKAEDVERELESMMARLCGDGVSSTPIFVEVRNSYIKEHLTLVDLPGIQLTSENVKMKEDILKMVKDQIQDPECIILAVSPAQDITNSVALSVAREVDPQKKRTIGVITKPDKATNFEADVVSVVKGDSEYNLKHGFYVLRSFNDSDEVGRKDEMTDAEQRRRESEYYDNEPSLADLRKYCGIEMLRRKLRQYQVQTILNCKSMKLKEVEDLIKKSEEELERTTPVTYIRTHLSAEDTEKYSTQLLMTKLVGSFNKLLCSRIDGVYNGARMNDLKPNSPGSQLFRLFTNDITRNMDQATLLEITPDDILCMRDDCNGMTPALEVSFRSAEAFIHQEIEDLDKSVREIGRKAAEILDTAISEILEEKDICVYPHAAAYLSNAARKVMKIHREEMSKELCITVDAENTGDFTSPLMTALVQFIELRGRMNGDATFRKEIREKLQFIISDETPDNDESEETETVTQSPLLTHVPGTTDLFGAKRFVQRIFDVLNDEKMKEESQKSQFESTPNKNQHITEKELIEELVTLAIPLFRTGLHASRADALQKLCEVGFGVCPCEIEQEPESIVSNVERGRKIADYNFVCTVSAIVSLYILDVKEKLINHVPKIIKLLFIRPIVDGLQEALLDELTVCPPPENVSECNDTVLERRRDLQKDLHLLKGIRDDVEQIRSD